MGMIEVRAGDRGLEGRRLRQAVRKIVCSASWEEVVMDAAMKAGIKGEVRRVAYGLAAAGIYPPASELGAGGRARKHAVRMVRCDACGRTVPPNNVVRRGGVCVCDDCRIEPDEEGEARTPGDHFGLLIEGRGAAGARLRRLGLTDSEVLALAFTQAGYSTRRVAELGRWSQTYACKLLASGRRKLKRSGLNVPAFEKGNWWTRPRCFDSGVLETVGVGELEQALKGRAVREREME